MTTSSDEHEESNMNNNNSGAEAGAAAAAMTADPGVDGDTAPGGTPTQPSASEGATSGEATAGGAPAADENAEPSPLEKGLDFTIGAALLTAEAAEALVNRLVEKGKIARESAPVVFDTLIERGRPTREQWLRTLREEILPQFKPGRPDAPAEEEIQVLEERVATLEQQVSTGGPDTNGPDAAAEMATPTDETIAQEATVLTSGEPASAPLPDAPPPFDISEAVTTDTPAEPEVAPTDTAEVPQLTETSSDAAVTGADTATDIEVGEVATDGQAAAPVEDGKTPRTGKPKKDTGAA